LRSVRARRRSEPAPRAGPVPARRVERHPCDRLGARAQLRWKAHDEVEGATVLEHLRHGLAGEGHVDRLRQIARGHAEARHRCAIGVDAELRDIGLLLDLEVGDTRHLAHHVAHPRAEPAQLPEIRPEDLDRDVRARPGEHVIDAVADRLADRDVRAGQHGEGLAKSRQQLLLLDVGAQRHVELGRVHALRVLVELGPSLPAVDVRDRRILEQDLLDAPADRVGLGEARPRHRHDRHGERALVELGQERRAEERQDRERRASAAPAPARTVRGRRSTTSRCPRSAPSASAHRALALLAHRARVRQQQ
jgi:hypothetical protein